MNISSLLPASLRKNAAIVTIVATKHGPEGEKRIAKNNLEDPFSSEYITDVNLFYFPNDLWRKTQGNRASGSIEFKNGSTQGKQNFVADSIEDLLEKMATFVKTL